MPLLIFWLIIFALAVFVIFFIASRHFSELAAFDATSVPHIQERSIKHTLAAKRMFRGLEKARLKAVVVLKPGGAAWEKVQKQFRDFANHVADRYRHLEWKQKWKVWKGRSRHERRAYLLKLLEEADEFRRAEHFMDAEQKYVEIISLDPRNVSAYVGLGKTYFRQERWKEAEEALQHVVETLDTTHELGWAFLGRARKALGNFEGAASAFRHALKINSEVSRRWMDLGECYEKIDRIGEAAGAYKRAAHLEPNNPKVLDQLVEISIIAGDKRLAREALTQLQSVNPENQKLVEWETKIGAM